MGLHQPGPHVDLSPTVGVVGPVGFLYIMSKSQIPAPMNVILFGDRTFVDVVKFR